jgi:membrane associated rhomboid family serine protease
MSEVAAAAECYRHPGRPTAISCQRCSQPICGDCMIAAPVGFHCPPCVTTGARRTRQINLVLPATPYLTYSLIAVNLLIAAACLVATPGWMGGRLGSVGLDWGLLGGGLTLRGRLPAIIGVDAGEWYRVFTGAFLHAGPIHAGFNMLLLWQTGSMLEAGLGRVRFGMLYLVALLGGSLGALLAAPDRLTVGASGAVFGLMGALFVVERKGMFGGRRSSIGFLIVVNLILSVAIPGISLGGHLGGLAAGAALGWLFQEFDQRKLPRAVPVATSACAAMTLFLASLWAASLWAGPLF